MKSTLKKLFTSCVIIIFSALSFTAYSQAPTMNIEGTAASIVSKLDKALILSEVQKPKLSTIVANYLRQKINIQDLQKTNEKAYTTKLNSMQNGLQSKLKPLLSLNQYSEFLSLKPKTFDETNVLSQLFY
ncbi:hypothetical protein DVR12_04770 [Chitinophaga silvatica]|uniref:Peptidylprolyl isomerase n=1 Tax=Chitinophaga silvatica TaxID=2282649 RepID=A0A3E1YDA4_9BACT|nr:hypothetical protein [Chitinophaga silvatica]RFS24525.1 hypothetical protein DVR12_04770 [Chitinophaga silvatica]